jgi:energy-coupling factor transporter transmembrane protein EcfT
LAVVNAQTATPTPPAPFTNAQPIGLTELVLLIIFFFFVALAFLIRDPFIFGIAAFISIILGLDLGLIYLGNKQMWIYGIVGFALVLFGFWLIYAALQFSLSKGGRRSK